MDTSDPRAGERARGVRVDDENLTVDLTDGRTIIVPLTWFPRLLRATPEERANWMITGDGFALRWPDIDEDLDTEGLLRGAVAPGGRKTFIS